MSVPFNKLIARIDLDAIRENYLLLREVAGNPAPVIKADAYGHGLLPVARTLAQAGAGSMCVGSVEEAVALRGEFSGRIVSLLGPLDKADAAAVVEHGLVPYIYRREQLAMLAEAARNAGGQARLALKFDTGMGRLGFRLPDVPDLVATLAANRELRLELVASHLATADEPARDDYVVRQRGVFEAVCSELRAAGLDFACTLGNSAGLLAYPELRYDLQRPGIALYGVNPFCGTPLAHLGERLRPAMSVRTPVAQVHSLDAGESVSYGCTFVAPKAMRVAVIAAGYADCYSRALGGKAEVVIRGRRAKVCGRVCMQLSIVDVSDIPGAEAGDDAWLLGGEGDDPVTPDELAGWWGTITYEVFCLLGLNKREYVDGL
ncbi:alanine racemase [Desulfovibrio sp. X2]|uniref:alanine racemase n=1 Tax=Desulfovibrio sp. X2 TaxID=941449 RepID=UPI00054FEB07|nr:alanine racemase [Desulfovibrio sp. X2]